MSDSSSSFDSGIERTRHLSNGMNLTTFRLNAQWLPVGIKEMVCIQGRLTAAATWSGTLLPSNLVVLSCAWGGWIARMNEEVSEGWHLSGPSRSPHQYHASGYLHLFVVLIEPTWLQGVLGVDIARLTGRRESIGYSLTGKKGSLALYDISTTRDVHSLIEGIAYRFASVGDDSTQLARNIGVRQQQRLHRNRTGMDQRSYRTVTRFQNAISQLAGAERLSSIAQKHGYADQSHFCRECRKYAHMSPESLRYTLRHSPTAMLNRESLSLSRVIAY